MPDEEIEKIDSQNDPSADDENTESEDEGSDDSEDTEEGKSQDDDSEGEEDDKSGDKKEKAPFTDREKRYYAQMKKAQGFKLVDGKWVKPPKTEPKPSPKVETPDVSAEVQKALDKRDLEALDLSSEVKTEIKNYAKLHKVSVLEAAKSPYITFVKSEAEKKARAEDAAAGGKRRAQPKSNFADAKPEDFDLSTKEGRESWARYKEFLKNS